MSTQSAPAPAPIVGEPIPYMGMQAVFRVTKEMSGGTYQAFEHITPPGTGVPLHTHPMDEETLFVEQGRIACRVGEDRFVASAGASVRLPAGIPHAWRAEGAETALVLVVAHLASGADFERMFRRLSALGPDELEAAAPEICEENAVDLVMPMEMA